MELDYGYFTHEAHRWAKSDFSKNEFSVEDGLVWIKLSQGQATCIQFDDWDLPGVKSTRWCAWLPKDCNSFYVKSTKGEYLHRLLLGAASGFEVDHKNLNGLDNRREINLRLTTSSFNKANKPKTASNKSGYKGVGFKRSHGLWRARISKDGVEETLGYFTTPVEAAKSYDSRARELFGEFARLNFS